MAELNPAQSRAARGLLNLTQQELAAASDLSLRTVVTFEKGGRSQATSTARAIQKALEAAGIEFIGDTGVQLKRDAQFATADAAVEGIDQ